MNQQRIRKGAFFMPAHPVHLSRIKITNEDITIHEGYKDTLEGQIYIGPTVTCFHNGEPVAMFGFVPIWKGLAEAWFVVDDEARKYPIAMTKYGKCVQDIAMISMGLHRLQITVRNSDKRAKDWAYAIGFQKECLMSRYGPDGSDYLLMARF
jgi:hypothetical protein